MTTETTISSLELKHASLGSTCTRSDVYSYSNEFRTRTRAYTAPQTTAGVLHFSNAVLDEEQRRRAAARLHHHMRITRCTSPPTFATASNVGCAPVYPTCRHESAETQRITIQTSLFKLQILNIINIDV